MTIIGLILPIYCLGFMDSSFSKEQPIALQISRSCNSIDVAERKPKTDFEVMFVVDVQADFRSASIPVTMDLNLFFVLGLSFGRTFLACIFACSRPSITLVASRRDSASLICVFKDELLPTLFLFTHRVTRFLNYYLIFHYIFLIILPIIISMLLYAWPSVWSNEMDLYTIKCIFPPRFWPFQHFVLRSVLSVHSKY